MVKNLLAMQETWIRSLDLEDTLKKDMATYSSILAWRVLWTEEPGGLQSMGSQRVGWDQATNIFTNLKLHAAAAKNSRDSLNTFHAAKLSICPCEER